MSILPHEIFAKHGSLLGAVVGVAESSETHLGVDVPDTVELVEGEVLKLGDLEIGGADPEVD